MGTRGVHWCHMSSQIVRMVQPGGLAGFVHVARSLSWCVKEVFVLRGSSGRAARLAFYPAFVQQFASVNTPYRGLLYWWDRFSSILRWFYGTR
jgi:hypothetical protein